MSFHGNLKEGCPKCHEERLESESALKSKNETIEVLNKSLLEAEAQNKSMADLASSMAGMMSCMKEFMDEMKEQRRERAAEKQNGGRAEEDRRLSEETRRHEEEARAVKGLREHLRYIVTMFGQGIYDTRALVAYDAAICDKANKREVSPREDPFTGIDTNLSNFHLGYAGTKHARGLASGGSGVSRGQGHGGRGGGRGGYQRQSFSGWKKLAAEKG